MLGKLMKYDMKYMARVLPWLYLGALAMSFMMSLFGALSVKTDSYGFMIFTFLGITPFVSLIVAIGVCSSVFMMIRIYKNMFSDEGYLTFTLPVKTHTVVWSKLLTGAIWNLVGTLVTVAVIIMPVTIIMSAYASADPQTAEFISFELNNIRETIGMISEVPGFGANAAAWAVRILLGLFSGNALFMFSCCLAQLLSKSRGIAAVGIYLGFNFVVSLLTSSSTQIFNYSLAMYEDISDFSQFYSEVMYRTLEATLPSLIITAAVTALSIFFSCRIVKKKLNMV